MVTLGKKSPTTITMVTRDTQNNFTLTASVHHLSLLTTPNGQPDQMLGITHTHTQTHTLPITTKVAMMYTLWETGTRTLLAKDSLTPTPLSISIQVSQKALTAA